MQPLPRYRIYSSARDYWAVAREVATRSWLRGDACEQLERAVCERHQVAHALCIAKARVGIFVTLRALIEPGQEVVLSPYTISDVVNMVLCAGGVPVFADLDPDTCNVAADELDRLVDDQTGAVLITHLHGLACDMERIPALCRERGVPLVEDAAQAFGARFGGQAVGTFGVAGIYSYGMYKNVNSFFGGMIVGNDDELMAKLRGEVDAFPPQEIPYYLSKVREALTTDLATLPPVFKALTYRVFRYGFLNDVGLLNSQVATDANPESKCDLPESYLRRMTPMQARIVTPQLGGVDDSIRARVAYAQRYHAGLSGVDGIGLPPLRTDSSHTYTYFPIQVEDRQGVLQHMMRERCDVAAQHLQNCAELDCFAEFARECPNARRTAQSVVLLPTYPRYSDGDVERNIRVLREFFGAV
jgi:dTDP-4-amino-4,6-dideoxygalactose transaminase